jgi:hypothetical protein
MAGSLLAVLMYKLIKALEYESANTDPEAALPPPNAEVAPLVRSAVADAKEEEESKQRESGQLPKGQLPNTQVPNTQVPNGPLPSGQTH